MSRYDVLWHPYHVVVSAMSTDLPALQMSRGVHRVSAQCVRSWSSLPESVTRLGQLHPAAKLDPLPPNHAHDRAALRARFGKYGVASGVDMARLWPSVQEVEEEMHSKLLVEYSDAVKEVAALRVEREKNAQARLDKIAKNERGYAAALANYEASQQKAEKEKDEREATLERRMREIHEYFGYWMDPKDPRFEVMLEQKEVEEKKAEKMAKRAESQKKKFAEVA